MKKESALKLKRNDGEIIYEPPQNPKDVARSKENLESFMVTVRESCPFPACHLGLAPLFLPLTCERLRLNHRLLINIVEMGGVEPPSKQRTQQLSTRLFFLWFSSAACRKTG